MAGKEISFCQGLMMVQPEFLKCEYFFQVFLSITRLLKPAVLVCTVSWISLSDIAHIVWSAKIAWFTWLTPAE